MKTILLVVAVGLGLLPSARAYSLAGPVGNGGDAWQQQVIGYGPPTSFFAPKNLTEEYRRNVPTVYYSYNTAFVGYFGPNGMAAVDGAMAVMNNLTNVSSYSTALSEFPLESRHINYQAQALGLFDLKSFTLGIMVEQMGLADPMEWVWTLHDRWHVGPVPCPTGMEYLVVQRNYDIVSSPLNQVQYSPYVNDVLYTYEIVEACAPGPVLALAVPFTVDPLADTFSPVASADDGSIFWGDFFTGLTRDDVAGLRYLLQYTNRNFETVSADSLLYTITTNTSAYQVFPPYLTGSTNLAGTNGAGYYVFNGSTNGGFGYGDLAAFLSFSSTNSPAAVQAAYPGVIVTSSSSGFIIASNIPNYYTYYKPAPAGSPYGTPPTLVLASNFPAYFEVFYTNTFANVFTNHYTTNSYATLQTFTYSAPAGSPYGTPAITNKSVKLINYASGDFFVLPPFYTNVCPLDIISSPIIQVQATTNFLTSGTTNFVTTTNTLSVSNSISLVTYFTNYSYETHPVSCTVTSGATGIYHGIENVKFVFAQYDSLIGQNFQPITNNYTMVLFDPAQNKDVLQHFQRIVTTPDYLFDAQDMATGPSSGVHGVFTFGRNLDFDTADVPTGQAGPGTITSPTTITFDKVGPVYFNSYGDVMNGSPYFTNSPGSDITDLYYGEYFVWASYNGTTNAPVVYPNGTSTDDLGNLITVQISPTTLPIGYAGYKDVTYTVTFTTTGGSFSPPYTWSATGLPSGLTVVSNPDNTATLTGNPTQSGYFVFNLTMTDSLGRSVQWAYPITIQ